MQDETIVQDDTFYFDNVVFQVCRKSISCSPGVLFSSSSNGQAENVLFKLPRQLLAGSGVFADMFALPPGENGQEEGRDNEHPIKLPGVTADEFRGFLKTVHPMSVHSQSSPQKAAHNHRTVAVQR